MGAQYRDIAKEGWDLLGRDGREELRNQQGGVYYGAGICGN